MNRAAVGSVTSRAAVLAGVCALAGCGGSAGSGSGMMGAGSGTDTGSGAPGPLDPPSNVHTELVAGSDHCILAWTAPAQPVDGYEIRASVAGWVFSDEDNHGGIAPGIATQAELDFSQTAAHELSRIDLRIRSRNHREFSPFASAVTCVLPVEPPQEVVTAIQPGGIAVTWVTFSSVATTLEVERATLDAAGAPGPWSPVATLPAPRPQDSIIQTQVDTTAVAASTAYGYRVSAVAPGGERGTSRVASSLRLGAPLATSTVMLPPANVAVADGKGHYALFSALFSAPFSPASSLHVTWGDGATWTSSPAITAVAYPPLVRLDAAGLPHTVYGKPPGSGTGVVLTHGWSDGTRWLEEPIAQRSPVSTSSGGPTLVFDLDGTGTPVMMWSLGNDRFEAAIKVAGSWTVQPLDTLIAFSPLGPFTVFGDASGVPHLVVATLDGIRHIQFRGGAWSGEFLPGGTAVIQGPLLGAGHDPDHLAVCYDDIAPYFMAQPACVRKTPAGWGKLERLGALPGQNRQIGTVAWIAMSADGQRLAVLHQNAGSQLFRSDGGGAWTENAFPAIAAPGQPEPAQFVGFDASGKLFTLVDPTAATDGSMATVAYRLSSEP